MGHTEAATATSAGAHWIAAASSALQGQSDAAKSAYSEEPLCLLYVTPEKVAKSKRLMAKLEKAHAVSGPAP
jgi:hypothetical protein